ncbi:uncharacterized protein UTRI_01457 [Ustilago trichophora]|uniref:Uncharacterized protein n=1 Tax=Ustilago trichophora TaxID=86804 RepID=A0A5C3E084_9BASI|nr:uncharacterized protein UTRI_01457 [Ustilago trichophora]
MSTYRSARRKRKRGELGTVVTEPSRPEQESDAVNLSFLSEGSSLSSLGGSPITNSNGDGGSNDEQLCNDQHSSPSPSSHQSASGYRRYTETNVENQPAMQPPHSHPPPHLPPHSADPTITGHSQPSSHEPPRNQNNQDPRSLYQEYETLRQAVDQLRADRDGIVRSLHWLDKTIRRIDPAVTRSDTATRPPLPPLNAPHRGGGGSKDDKPLQAPFRDEICHRMGLLPKDPLPPFEQSAPTVHGAPVLRFDWSQDPNTYAPLVHSILDELCGRQQTIASHVQAIGGIEEGRRVCMASLGRLFKDWRRQQRDAVEPARKTARESRRRQRTRTKKKCRARAALLARSPALQRKYHGADFTLEEAASVEVTDDEQGNQGDLDPQLFDESGRLTGSNAEAGGGGDDLGRRCAQPGALQKEIPCWRSLELHRALHRLEEAKRREESSQPVPQTQLRQRGEHKEVRYPPLDNIMAPLPSLIQRWMVSAEFAKLFPAAVSNVTLNTIVEPTTDSEILTPKQWGQHPPYEVVQVRGQEHNTMFLGEDSYDVRNNENLPVAGSSVGPRGSAAPSL